jgi:hypothetical protein
MSTFFSGLTPAQLQSYRSLGTHGVSPAPAWMEGLRSQPHPAPQSPQSAAQPTQPSAPQNPYSLGNFDWQGFLQSLQGMVPSMQSPTLGTQPSTRQSSALPSMGSSIPTPGGMPATQRAGGPSLAMPRPPQLGSAY